MLTPGHYNLSCRGVNWELILPMPSPHILLPTSLQKGLVIP